MRRSDTFTNCNITTVAFSKHLYLSPVCHFQLCWEQLRFSVSATLKFICMEHSIADSHHDAAPYISRTLLPTSGTFVSLNNSSRFPHPPDPGNHCSTLFLQVQDIHFLIPVSHPAFVFSKFKKNPKKQEGNTELMKQYKRILQVN